MNPNQQMAAHFKQLNQIGIALSVGHDLDTLLETILTAARGFTNADAGTMYLYDAEKGELIFQIVHNDTLKLTQVGEDGGPISLPAIPLMDKKGFPNHRNVASHAALSGTTINIPDAYADTEYDFSGTVAFDRLTGYLSRSFLTVPMRDHEGKITGVLQLINAQNPETGYVIPFSRDDQELAESLASQAAVALNNGRLIMQLESLIESLIEVINTAIDDKSPYTKGHCERVPILTMMLAEAAHDASSGPLAEFKLSQGDRRELRIAAMLHDCGKISTPVHVVDKATKLETIFDRIHLVDSRFELLRRDAEIVMLRRVAQVGEGTSEAEEARHSWHDRLEQLGQEQELLHRCNIGGEFMPDEEIQRVRNIARQQWRDARGNWHDLLSADEVENLCIRSGTLTAQEREIINHHIDVTLSMLKAITWPAQYQNVAEFAGGHHERMDGKGYPHGLAREQMSVQARIMGIADIFEALTARDRPYKKGKTLSESLSILNKMRDSGHIDPDLLDIFLQEKVYLTYAERFLSPEQIDTVESCSP